MELCASFQTEAHFKLKQSNMFLFATILSLARGACATELKYFLFDEIKDGKIIGPHLNGTPVGSPVLVPGIKGQALSLNGVDQYVDFGNHR